MKDLFVKDANGGYIPIELNLISANDLINKLIVITVKADVDEEGLYYVYEAFHKSEMIMEAMKSSMKADLLIMPYTIEMELMTTDELANKTICITAEKNELDRFPELKAKIKGLGKFSIIPSPITIAEYEEVKAVQERIKLRKQRNGGAIIK